MKEKLATFFVCLVFALPFGGVGAGAAYVIGATVRDGMRAKEWVKVKAQVETFGDGNVLYRYQFGGKSYTGDRLGSNVIGGTDNVDSWHDDMEAMLSAAKSENRPITVYVNPDQPSESMVDREIRWKLMLFALPFALAFGGVGLGALVVMGRSLMPEPSKEVVAARAAKASARRTGGSYEANPGFLWVFAFFWNALSFPIAILMVPQVIAEGQWLGLLILLFPLIGVLVIWSAIVATYKWLRGGSVAQQAPAPAKPKPKMVETFGEFKDQAAAFVREDEAPKPAALGPEMERLLDKLDATPEQRRSFAAMTPQERAMAGKVVKVAPYVKKIVIGAIILYVAWQVVEVVVSFF